MARSVLLLCKYLLICVTTLALVTIGFAHRSGTPSLSPELAAYVDAGGSLSDICGTEGGDGNVYVTDCEACRIGDDFALLGSGQCQAPQLSKKTFVFAFIAKRLAERGMLDAARLVRAPPQA